MLDNIRSVAQGWLGKLLLALITIPFALFGIDSYLKNAGEQAAVANVNGDTVTIQGYENALKNMRSRFQAEGMDVNQLDSPEIKAMVLNKLIDEKILLKEIKDAKFAISDNQLATYVTGMPEFQNAGKFSQELYDQLLTQNNLTPTTFEAGMRSDLLAQQAQDSVPRLGFISNARKEQALKMANQKRIVSIAEIKSKDFVNEVKLDDKAVTSYYEKNKDKLLVPEKVKIEFVVLSANSLIGSVNVDDKEIKQFYDDNLPAYQGDEQRRASHILIGFGVNATAEQKNAAKAKAEAILATLKIDPKQFESIAIKESQDPGSATKGGDLGAFGRGAMVKPFEEAAFKMKVDEISDLVESEFGFHIIKVTEILGQSNDFESVKAKVKGDLMFQKAQLDFAEKAENFSNMVYEQSDSLAPVAKAISTQVQTSDWMSREEGNKFFKNEKLMALVFAPESIQDRRNTEAVEVTPNNLVAARVIDYKASTPRAFEEVKQGIEDLLKFQEANKLADQKGKEALKMLQEGKSVPNLDWIPEVTVDRKHAEGLTDLAMRQVFKTSTAKLPSYSGLSDERQGYLLVKVVNVEYPDLTKQNDLDVAEGEFDAAIKTEYLASYKKSLRDKSKVSVNDKLLLGTPNN
jgi:peptidyl-prolyl cis-trans isomerase D